MNAKKIMGAVLVALLAAALFVGAGAAETGAGETVFVYQAVPYGTLGSSGTGYAGTWVNGANTISIVNGVITGKDVVAGTYKKGDDSIYVSYPTASYAAVAGTSTKYAVTGTVYQNDVVALTVEPKADNVTLAGVYVSYQGGTPLFESYPLASNYFSQLGTYTIVAAFNTQPTDADGLVDYTPNTYLIDTLNALTFKVVKAGSATITAAADNVLVGETIKVTVTGQPGVNYKITTEGVAVDIPTGQPSDITAGVFEMPNTGSAVIYIDALLVAGDVTINVQKADGTGDIESVDVEVVEGEITAVAEKDSYYIGNTIKLSGTSTVGSADLYIYVKGTNYPLVELINADVEVDTAEKTWTAEIEVTDFPDKTDAGTYTFYVAVLTSAENVDQMGAYTTVGVNLIQPFISITSVPEVVVQDKQFEIKGTAEATGNVKYYIFGTNFFYNNTAVVKDGTFTIKATMYSSASNAAGMKAAEPGQYFLVVQHKMYDGLYNIYADAEGNFWLNATTTDASGNNVYAPGEILFNVGDRQTANAAQALCDALETENIDDMYVKASFIVAAPTSVINPIPAEITKGTKLTVSGTTTGAEGELVTVDMLSTAFAAVPKDTVGSASFISLTTKVQEDGTWEVTFDTSNLNVDEYTISAAVGSLSKTTTKVNVIEGAPVTPVDPVDPVDPKPVDPVTPTEPETPGFGALAALAGLGAVAVLLLRRE